MIKKIVRVSPDPGLLWNDPTPANQSRIPKGPEVVKITQIYKKSFTYLRSRKIDLNLVFEVFS